MLNHLHIRNFTLVEVLNLELKQGLTVITGETGAGKSILLDALGLTLGDRSDSGKVRLGAERAEVSASFDTSLQTKAQRWLKDHALDMDQDSENECLIRRIVTAEGRSRSWINGQPATLQQLRELGELLVDMHGQHEHQSLLKKDTHRQLLDAFCNTVELAKTVRQSYKQWQTNLEQLTELKNNSAENTARYQLLSYQVEELQQLNIQPDEIEEQEQEQQRLNAAGEIISSCERTLNICEGEDGFSLQQGLNQCLQLLQNLPEQNTLNEAIELFSSAKIQIEEAAYSLQHFRDRTEIDPEKLQSVEERLSAIYDTARKHRSTPEQLPELLTSLQTELEQLDCSDERIATLEASIQAQHESYQQLACNLSQKRQKGAAKLSKAANEQLAELAMASANLKVNFKPVETKHGLEDIEFLISTNPGQPHGPLHKIASGGELSRISLAIQVITAQTSQAPTLVFDEVDVGIGGATGDVVGKLLRNLGSHDNSGQVLCVTHLAQVASKAHQHLRVEKHSTKDTTQTQLIELTGDEKVEEIARMISGQLTEQSKAHAKELLQI